MSRRIRRRGFATHIYEILNGAEYDMTKLGNIRRLKRDAKRGRLRGAMVAITCTSWSVARNRTNVIRTRREPWGVSSPLKPFSEKDEAALRSGNLQLRRLLPLLRLLTDLGIPWILENPASSNIWWVPALMRLMNHKRCEAILIDQCAFGQPWRKRTRLLCANCDPHDVHLLSMRRCSGTKVCSFTNKKHIQLTGSAPGGKPMTSLAQEFPIKMANVLGDLLVSKDLGR